MVEKEYNGIWDVLLSEDFTNDEKGSIIYSNPELFKVTKKLMTYVVLIIVGGILCKVINEVYKE